MKDTAFFGWFADRSTSRRTPLMIGLLALGSATIMSCVGKSVYILLFSRMLQGVSSAAVYAVGLALLVDTVGRDEVGHWMGFALSSSSIGLVISPVLGGIVYSRAGYYAVFGMILGLIVFDILLRMLMIEKKSVEQWEIQIANHNYSTFSSDDSTQHNVSKSDVREEEGERERAKGPSHWLSVVGMIKNGHLHHKIVSVSRDLPPIFTLLRSPHVLTAIYGVFVQVTILVSFDATLPLFVERKFGWDSMKAGLVFLNLAVPALGGPLAGWLSDRYGPRWVAITGCLLTTPLLVLLRVVDGNVPFHVWLLCGFLILIGLYLHLVTFLEIPAEIHTNVVCNAVAGTTLTLIISPLAAELSLIVERIEHDRPEFLGNASGAYGQAFALFNCSVAAATLAGPVVADFIESRFGWECMTWMLAIFCASGAVPVVCASKL